MDTSVFAVALGAALVVAFFAGTGLEVAALSSLVEPVDRRVLLRVPRVDVASASPVSSARFRCRKRSANVIKIRRGCTE